MRTSLRLRLLQDLRWRGRCSSLVTHSSGRLNSVLLMRL